MRHFFREMPLRWPKVCLEPDYLAAILIAAWPFAFLWVYVFDVLSIGNDFAGLYYNYKIYLLTSLREGHFPLWSPGEAAGLPFVSNPYNQPFYPLNLIYYLYFILLNRFSEWDYTLFTISGLSIFGLGLYFWLRRLLRSVPVALAAVLIALMSLKVTELIRFPNAVHSAAWMPWLLLGITLAADRRQFRMSVVVIGVSTLMLLTAGYPYFIVYAFILTASYAAAMFFPPVRNAIQCRSQQQHAMWMVVSIGGAASVAALTALPWLLQVGDLLTQMVDRASPSFEFATAHHFGVSDTIGSWIFPPAAMMEGWYYFGMLSGLLIAGYLLTLWFIEEARRERLLIVVVLIWMMVVIYFTWGQDSILFSWAWAHLAVIDRMRVWPRMNIILVPAITLILAFGLTFFLRLLENAKEKRGDALHFLIAIGVASAAALAAQSFMVHNSVLSGYWSDYFKLGVVSKSIDFGLAGRWLRGFDERFFPLMTMVSFGVLAGLVLVAGQRRVARPAALVVVLLVALLDLYPVSSFQWPYRLTPMPAQASVERMLRAAYDRPRVIGPGTIDPFSGTQNVGLLDNWDFQRHAAVYLRYFNRDGLPLASVNAETISAVKRFYGADEHAQRLFLSSTIAHSGIGTFMGDVEALGARSNPKMRVMGYNGDTIDIEVKVDQPGWLSFIDNWDPNWVATIDDRTVPIERLFGSYKSVAVPAGLSLITFSYRPPWFGWLP